jgi:hypothetical protein
VLLVAPLVHVALHAELLGESANVIPEEAERCVVAGMDDFASATTWTP